MVADELLLDPAIRDWVLIPITVVMLLIGIFRHNVSMLLKSETKKAELQSIADTQALSRSAHLRANSNQIPRDAFYLRKYSLSHKEKGYFNGEKRANPINMMQDPNAMMDMMKGNLSMVIPQMLMMGWINYFFHGFLTIRVPFPLTLRFKTMLQRGVDLQTLDASWVSSLSWYFLNVFGLRGVHAVILGANNEADQAKLMEQQMSGGISPQGQAPDMNKLFTLECENLELVSHSDDVLAAEERLLRKIRQR